MKSVHRLSLLAFLSLFFFLPVAKGQKTDTPAQAIANSLAGATQIFDLPAGEAPRAFTTTLRTLTANGLPSLRFSIAG